MTANEARVEVKALVAVWRELVEGAREEAQNASLGSYALGRAWGKLHAAMLLEHLLGERLSEPLAVARRYVEKNL